MSAYLVSDDTLDLLASASTWGNHNLFVFVYPGTLPPRSDLRYPGEGESISYTRSDHKNIREELRRENIASLWARYPKGGHDTPPGEPFRNIFSDQASHADVLGALACYEYQACESNEWRESYAYALCAAIRKNVCSLIASGKWDYERPIGQVSRVSLMDILSDKAKS